jgi:hypothetical protein
MRRARGFVLESNSGAGRAGDGPRGDPPMPVSIPGSSVRQYTVLVSIRTRPVGKPDIQYRSIPNYEEARNASIVPFSQVGWMVYHVNTKSYPPFQVVVDNPTLFGQNIIESPRGGHSGYQSVRVFSGSTKYTVVVPSLGVVDDPEMHVDPESDSPANLAQRNFVITANLEHQPFTYTLNNGASQVLPPSLEITAGDTVEWRLAVSGQSDIWVQFQRMLIPPSPFDPTAADFELAAPDSSTGKLMVLNGNGGSPNFPYVLIRGDGTVLSQTYSLALA